MRRAVSIRHASHALPPRRRTGAHFSMAIALLANVFWLRIPPVACLDIREVWVTGGRVCSKSAKGTSAGLVLASSTSRAGTSPEGTLPMRTSAGRPSPERTSPGRTLPMQTSSMRTSPALTYEGLLGEYAEPSLRIWFGVRVMCTGWSLTPLSQQSRSRALFYCSQWAFLL